MKKIEKFYKFLGFSKISKVTKITRCPHCQCTKREHFDAATPRGVVAAWLCSNCERGYDKTSTTRYWAKEIPNENY